MDTLYSLATTNRRTLRVCININSVFQEVARIKKEKENLEQQLKTMGLTPQAGPSYLPSLAEMKSGPNVVLSGLPMEPPSRDRSYTTDSYAGDLNIAPEFTSNRNDEMDMGPRIRTSSMGEGAIETRDLNTVKVEVLWSDFSQC